MGRMRNMNSSQTSYTTRKVGVEYIVETMTQVSGGDCERFSRRRNLHSSQGSKETSLRSITPSNARLIIRLVGYSHLKPNLITVW